jgi:hypothetical protein
MMKVAELSPGMIYYPKRGHILVAPGATYFTVTYGARTNGRNTWLIRKQFEQCPADTNVKLIYMGRSGEQSGHVFLVGGKMRVVAGSSLRSLARAPNWPPPKRYLTTVWRTPPH